MNSFKFCFIGCCLAGACLTPAAVFADTYTITDYSSDPNSYWGGVVTGKDGWTYPDFAYDAVGGNDFDVDTLTVSRDSNSFSAVLTGQYFTTTPSNAANEFIGDLFLTSNWNPIQTGPSDTHYATDVAGSASTTWEYVLRIMDGNVLPGSDATGTIGLYKVDSNGQILLSDDTVQDSVVYRAGQEVQYSTTDPALKTGTWTLDATTGTFTFSLSLAGLDDDELAFLEGSLGLHWTMSCGNDVIEGQIPAMGASSVPEPATMLLFGAGLSGLAAYRRRARK